MIKSIASDIRGAFPDLFESAEEFLDLSFNAFAYKDHATSHQTQDIHHAVAALFVKSFRLFKSTLLLAEQGLASECLAINRIAFESYLYLAWINKADDLDARTNRCRDLLAWHVLTRSKTMKKIYKESDGESLKFKKPLDRIEFHLQTLKKRMSAAEWDRFNEYGPYGDQRYKLQIDELAIEVGMIKEYNRLYKIGSEVIHSQDLLTYTERDSQTHALILIGHDDRFIKETVVNAIKIHLGALSIVSRILRLHLSDKLKIMGAKLNKKFP